MNMEQRDRPSSYFYKVEDIIILSDLEGVIINLQIWGVWIMYMAMIWWLQNRKEGTSGWLRCATWCVVSHAVSWYRHPRSGPRANWCQAERLWAKWENYTFWEESAAVVGAPFTVRLQFYLCSRVRRLAPCLGRKEGSRKVNFRLHLYSPSC